LNSLQLICKSSQFGKREAFNCSFSLFMVVAEKFSHKYLSILTFLKASIFQAFSANISNVAFKSGLFDKNSSLCCNNM
jgi:hypothetical protein